jgi:probable rRNA maturation factor
MLSFPQMKINITIDAGLKKLISPFWLRRVARLALETEHAGAHAEMGLVITGDENLHRLNRDYLEEDHPTDVLSFPMLESFIGADTFIDPPDGILHLGEVIISYPQAVKQAKEHSHSTEKEIAILLIHGILHLLGHDHDITAREQAMRTHEIAILKITEATLL